MPEEEKERQIRARLARVEGQIRGIQRMIDTKRPCDEILTQLLAARTALDRAAGEIVGTYVNECLLEFPPEEAQAKIGPVIKLLTRVS